MGNRVNSLSVSAIVVNHNGEKYIERCLGSLCENSYPAIEIIVVDNNSSDRSLEILRSFSQVRLIASRKNLWYSSGCNLGAKDARGSILLFLNHDVYVRPDSIEKMVELFSRDSGCGIVGFKLLYPDTNIIQHAGGVINSDGSTSHIGYKEQDTGQYERRREVDYVTGAILGIRRSLFRRLGGFDLDYSYFEETDLCIKTQTSGFKVVYCPNCIAYHYESVGLGVGSKRYSYFYNRGRLLFLVKNYGLKRVLFNFRPLEIKWRLRKYPRDVRIAIIKSHLSFLLWFGKKLCLRS